MAFLCPLSAARQRDDFRLDTIPENAVMPPAGRNAPSAGHSSDVVKRFAKQSHGVARHPHPGGEYQRICRELGETEPEVRIPALRTHFRIALPAVPTANLERAVARSVELATSVEAMQRGSLLAHIGEQLTGLPTAAMLHHINAVARGIAACPIAKQASAIRPLARALAAPLEPGHESKILSALTDLLEQHEHIDRRAVAKGRSYTALPHALDVLIARFPRTNGEPTAQYFSICRNFIGHLPAGERPARIKALRRQLLSMSGDLRSAAFALLQDDYRAATGREDPTVGIYTNKAYVVRKNTIPKTMGS